jgi:hypothetical protein
MTVVAHVLPHIVAALRRYVNDERDLCFSWVQIQDLFGRDREVIRADT